MELDKAREIIKVLADGIDPATGYVLPQESPYNSPSVIRALFTILESIKDAKKPKKTNDQKQQDNIDSGKQKNAGLPWTDELKKKVASKFRSGSSIDELSEIFERTKGAIVSQLMNQELIESNDAIDYRKQDLSL